MVEQAPLDPGDGGLPSIHFDGATKSSSRGPTALGQELSMAAAASAALARHREAFL